MSAYLRVSIAYLVTVDIGNDSRFFIAQRYVSRRQEHDVLI